MTTAAHDIMLDLETMGTGPDAAIIAIGAVAFDIDAGLLGDNFYTTIDLESAVKNGGVMDPSTVLWWMQQSDAARDEFNRPGLGMPQALYQFRHWIERQQQAGGTNSPRVWGNGADFDNIILASAYQRAGLIRPWGRYANRCYRTIKSLHPSIKLERSGTHHNALDDAKSQALHLIAMLKVSTS